MLQIRARSTSTPFLPSLVLLLLVVLPVVLGRRPRSVFRPGDRSRHPRRRRRPFWRSGHGRCCFVIVFFFFFLLRSPAGRRATKRAITQKNEEKPRHTAYHTARSRQRLDGRRRPQSGFRRPESHSKVPLGQLRAPLADLPAAETPNRAATPPPPPHLL